MMNRRMLTNVLLAIGLAGCASNGMHRGHADVDDDHDEVKVAFADVPATVRTMIFSESRGATPATVDREMRGGREIYEADVRVDGVNREVVVAADGTLISNKVDDDADEDEKPKAK